MSILPLLFASLLAAQSPDDPEPPKPGPVVVKLVLKKTTYKLDLQGMTQADYERAAKAGKATPIPLEGELEITNTSKTSMRVRVVGSGTPVVTLTLTGPGVIESNQVTLIPAKAVKANAIVVVGPGQKATIPVGTLTTQSTPRSGKHLYFTKPGTYKLETTVRTAFYLDYMGGVGKGGAGKLTYLTPKARAVELTVEK